MEKIFSSIFGIIATIITVATLICIDIPLKIISFIFFLLLAIMVAILYPLAKKWNGPQWLSDWYDYLVTNKWIARSVSRMWS